VRVVQTRIGVKVRRIHIAAGQTYQSAEEESRSRVRQVSSTAIRDYNLTQSLLSAMIISIAEEGGKRVLSSAFLLFVLSVADDLGEFLDAGQCRADLIW